MDWIFDMYDWYNSRQNRYYYLSLLETEEGADINWYIHGLWPQFDANNCPTYCRTVTFDINKLFPIMPALEKYWYAEGEKNDAFWDHEWEKHGSCMFTEMDELQYFQTTLTLYGEAIKKGLPEKYYKNGKCLIPVGLDLKFIVSNPPEN